MLQLNALENLDLNICCHLNVTSIEHFSYVDQCEYIRLNCVIAMKLNDCMVNVKGSLKPFRVILFDSENRNFKFLTQYADIVSVNLKYSQYGPLHTVWPFCLKFFLLAAAESSYKEKRILQKVKHQ